MNLGTLKKFYNETLDLLIFGPRTPKEEEQYIYAMGHEPNEYWNYEDHIRNFEFVFDEVLENSDKDYYPLLFESLQDIRSNIDRINNRIMRDWYYGCRKFLVQKNGSKSKEELIQIAKDCGIKKAKKFNKKELINKIKEELSGNYLLQLQEKDFDLIFPKE